MPLSVRALTEYVKLICDDDGSLNRRLFYDNVRDFQGHNPVNQEMAATIQEAGRGDRFALLNNGVTIVARDVNKVGTRFRLRDYQIVNGCQTSHIVYLNQAQLTPNIYLPVKLIVTTDSEVTNQIIQGTNRQTEVKLEAFESLTPFQKKLEELYLAFGRGQKDPLYYERRSKQYDHLNVRKERIVTLATQINCFIAMFLNEPHSTHRYYGELLSSYRTRLFSEAHSPWPYYLSGAALARVERLFAEGRLARALRGSKYQLLMVYRLQNEPGDVPRLNSKDIQEYCEALLKRLDDDEESAEAFRRASAVVEATRADRAPWSQAPERTRAFTVALLDAAPQGTQAEAATIESVSGIVKAFSDTRGFGFIKGDDGSEVFVHHTGIAGEGFRSLRKGTRVRFVLAETERGPRAVNVEPLEEA